MFEGGTSLSKAHALITRFSEDVDLTVDVRVLLELGEIEETEWLPKTRSAAERFRERVQVALPTWIAGGPLLALENARMAEGLEDRMRIEQAGDVVTVRYEPDDDRDRDADPDRYVHPGVLLEFGGRSTGEPVENRMITCDLAPVATNIIFPATEARVMVPERTWWEKATATHVFCQQGRLRGERQARHWYDLVMLEAAGIAASAIGHRAIEGAVARHKSMMFREKDADGAVIDYHAAIAGSLRLVPEGAGRTALADDYARMRDAGLLPTDAPSFDVLLEGCVRMERAANAWIRDYGTGINLL